jgi:hypothetical protein
MDASSSGNISGNAMTPAPVVQTAQVYTSRANVRATEPAKTASSALEDRDQVELSSQGRRMQELMARKANQPANSTPPQEAETASEDKIARALLAKGESRLQKPEEAIAEELKDKEILAAQAKNEDRPLTDYEQKRMARLDQVDLLIREGKYTVDNFMVDRVAVRLAKLMV